MSYGAFKFSLTVLAWGGSGGIAAKGLTSFLRKLSSSYYLSEILEKEVKCAFIHSVTNTDDCDKAVFEQS